MSVDIAKVDARLAKVYQHEGDKQAHYDGWARDYEADVVGDLGYVAHLRAAEIFARVAGDKQARILDLGCGTGLVGATLTDAGYTNLHGADFSREMLEVARRREVYDELYQHDVSQPPPQNRDDYDALISVGLFSYGAPYISDLPNAVAFVKRGCRCVITVNDGAWVANNLHDAVQKQAAQHNFTIEEIVETDYLRKEKINAQVLIIRR